MKVFVYVNRRSDLGVTAYNVYLYEGEGTHRILACLPDVQAAFELERSLNNTLMNGYLPNSQAFREHLHASSERWADYRW